jgi:hypothetical protein
MTESTKPQTTWEEWYRTKHDHLTLNMGLLQGKLEKYEPQKWDAFAIETCRDLLDIANVQHKDIGALVTQIKDLDAKMMRIAKSHGEYIDRKDEEIKVELATCKGQVTDMAEKLKTWMGKYQRLLDAVADDYRDKLERVQDLDHR